MGTGTTVINLIFKEFIYGGHLQCLGAVGIAFVASILLDVEYAWHCFVVVYLLFYPSYLYNRHKELDIDEATNPDRTRHLRGYVGIMPLLLWSVIVIVIGMVLVYSNFATLVFSLILIGFGLLYTTAIKALTKRIPILKNLYVAAFFASLVFFPLFYFDVSVTPQIRRLALILTAFVYLKALAMQIFLDIKDIESDQQANLRTIPVLFGKARTIPYLQLVDIGLSVIFPLLLAYIYAPVPTVIWAFTLTVPPLLYCYKLVQAENYSGYMLRSGEFLSWFVLVFLFNYL